MKIALFTDTYAPQINGVTNTLEQVKKHFDHIGIEYKIFAPQYESKAASQLEEAHTERFYSLKLSLYPECRVALTSKSRITQVLSEFKPDLIHLITEFNLGVAGLNYGRKYQIPTISNYTTNFPQYTEYYNLDFLKQPIWEYMRWFHNQNAITMCPSHESQMLLHEKGIRNTGIFSRGIDLDRYSPTARSRKLRNNLGIQDKIAFLYVGRVSYEKDLDVLSQSYLEIKKAYGDKVALIIAGDGPSLKTYKAMFPSDVVFTGFKRGRELSELYASSDIFVCPSSTETFGNVVQEAMASGLPVIGAAAGGINELIQNRMNGLKFKAKDSKELTACMKELLENEPLRNTLANNGLDFVKGRSWGQIIGGLVDVYQTVLEQKKHKSA